MVNHLWKRIVVVVLVVVLVVEKYGKEWHCLGVMCRVVWCWSGILRYSLPWFARVR